MISLFVVIVAVLPLSYSFISINNFKYENKISCAKALILEGLPRIIELQTRPSPIGVPRKYMNLPFAVQMMRSSYNIVDELNCFPMDEFQKDFFLFRQNEWENYRNNHKNCIQGNLADPLYFDFISFAQYAIISNTFKNSKIDFIEKSGAEGTSTIVRRNNTVGNDQLPEQHSLLVGKVLYEYSLDTYPSITPKAIQIGNFDQLLINMQLLLDIFAINLYALSLQLKFIKELDSINEKPSYLVTVTSILPANLWSLQALQQRKDKPLNNFEIKVLQHLALLSGFKADLVSCGVADQVNFVYGLRIYQA